MAVKLTKRVVDAAAPGQTEIFIWDSELRGFGLRISPKSRKSFLCQFRVDGKTRREALGVYGRITADEARSKAKRLLGKAEDGIDLVAEVAEAVAAKKAVVKAEAEAASLAEALRFSALARRFISEHVKVKRKPTTQYFYEHTVEHHLIPAFGDRDAREIRRQDVEALHVALRSTATMANRVIAVLGAIYGWADRLDITPEGTRNPTTKVEKYTERARERFLSTDELARLGDAIRVAETIGIEWTPKEGGKLKHAPKPENRRVKLNSEAAAALRLLLFTGARLREILHLEWNAVDVERGLLRLRDSKVGPVTIVLNAPARAVLAAIAPTGRYVIRGTGDGQSEKPKSDLKKPWALVQKAAGLKGVRIHDLRHSFASVGAGDGHGLTIVGRLLNHSQTRTMQRYQHLGDDPLRKASDAIATRIATAMGEAPAAKSAEIVPIKRRAV